ncbi:E3 SUMO-protein ligase pli1, partial [Elasticomyces elasticus]
MAAMGGYQAQRQIQFKSSPFYENPRTLIAPIELKAREHTRDTARCNITFNHEQAQRFQENDNVRVMVFCAAESFEPAWKPQDIAFPHHAELKINQDDVRANLKGLKNKPGSTRPVDITPLLRKKAGQQNSLELVYALTSK